MSEKSSLHLAYLIRFVGYLLVLATMVLLTIQMSSEELWIIGFVIAGVVTAVGAFVWAGEEIFKSKGGER